MLHCHGIVDILNMWTINIFLSLLVALFVGRNSKTIFLWRLQWSLTESFLQSRRHERKSCNKDKKRNLLPLVYPPQHCCVSIFITLLQCASVVEDCSAILTNSGQIEWAWQCINSLLWIAKKWKLEFRYGGEWKRSGLGLPTIHQSLNAFSTLVNIHFPPVRDKMLIVADMEICTKVLAKKAMRFFSIH